MSKKEPGAELFIHAQGGVREYPLPSDFAPAACERCGHLPGQQYAPHIAAVMNAEIISTFMPCDFLALAIAALDQAGLSEELQQEIERLAEPEVTEAENGLPF